jgi:DNA-directed RNA polymerase sigma subunit (sigma70/sigma32)
LLATLPYRFAQLILHQVGFEAQQLTRQELARLYGVCEADVRSRQALAHKKLQHPARKRLIQDQAPWSFVASR